MLVKGALNKAEGANRGWGWGVWQVRRWARALYLPPSIKCPVRVYRHTSWALGKFDTVIVICSFHFKKLTLSLKLYYVKVTYMYIFLS